MPSDQGEAGRELAHHEADSVEAVISMYEAHDRGASIPQRAIDAVTDRLGRPAVVIGLVLCLAAWTALAAVQSTNGFDQPSYAWLELSSTLAALLIAVIILASQRRQDLLAERRAQLTLQLALLADKKMAKTIALLEEFRRENPALADRVDPESDDMAKPADPENLLAAIDERGKSEG